MVAVLELQRTGVSSLGSSGSEYGLDVFDHALEAPCGTVVSCQVQTVQGTGDHTKGACCIQDKDQEEAAAWVVAASTCLGAARSFGGEMQGVAADDDGDDEAAFAESEAVVGSGGGKAGRTYCEWGEEEHFDTFQGVDQSYEKDVEDVTVGGVSDGVVYGVAGDAQSKEFVSLHQ